VGTWVAIAKVSNIRNRTVTLPVSLVQEIVWAHQSEGAVRVCSPSAVAPNCVHGTGVARMHAASTTPRLPVCGVPRSPPPRPVPRQCVPPVGGASRT